MKVFRFMSNDEFQRLTAGCPLHSTQHHKGKRTDSIGFCFLKETDFTPEEAYDFLIGIVSDDICVLMETESEMLEGYGKYSDGYITEYSVIDYERETFVPVAYAIPELWEKWKWYNI